jgi:hypothetical protein
MPWYPCCCCRYCPNCRDGFGPFQWQVDISGLANSDPVECPECADLSGSFVLAWVAACRWEYDLPSAICGVAKIRLSVTPYVPIPPPWLVAVELLDAGGNVVMQSQQTFDPRPDCMAMDGQSLGPLNLPWGRTTCSISASDVSVTALRPCREEG